MRPLYSRSDLMMTSLSKSFVAGLAFISGRHTGSRMKSNIVLSAAKKSLTRSLSTISTAEDNMAHVRKRVELRADEMIAGLQSKGWVTIDNFLGPDVCTVYRSEAVGFYTRDEMTISKSTRWDSKTNSVVTYEKHNVFATQLNGGDSYYDGPRLHEYVVSLVKSLVPIISIRFPEACLDPLMASNKLAVCTGDGSYYDKHYDNSGGDDLRKLTVLYYLNPKWRKDMGGAFRIYESKESSTSGLSTSLPNNNDFNENPLETSAISYKDSFDIDKAGMNIETTDISPLGDRLLVFWSDRIVHSVQPSQVNIFTFPNPLRGSINIISLY